MNVEYPSVVRTLASTWKLPSPGRWLRTPSTVVVALSILLAVLLPVAATPPPMGTVGFLNSPRAEVPGTLLSHPSSNDSVTLGRTTTINYVNGWLIVGAEGPGSRAPYDLVKRVYDISDPTRPVRRFPSDFGLTYPDNRWIQNTDGWNGHGSAQSGPYLLPHVMRVETFGGPVELGGTAGIPNLGEMPLGHNRSSQAGPWEATLLWYGTPEQQMRLRRVFVGPEGATRFQELATFDHVGRFGGGDWHPMFFGDRLLYARSGGSGRDGVVVYRLEYHDPDDDGIVDSVTPHFISSLSGGFQGYWPNLFSDGTGLYVIGSATDILTSADVTAATSAAGGPVVAGPTLNLPFFSNASYPVYQDQFGFIHNRKVDMTRFLAGEGMNSVVLTLDENATGVDTTQISLPLGNLWITGGYPNGGRSQGMAVWVHQQAPDSRPPSVSWHLPEANRTGYPRHAPLSFLLHEHPRNGGPRNGVDFAVRPVAADGTTLGTFVPGFLIHDFSGVLTFTPSRALAADTTYQVDFFSDISDPAHPVGFQDAAGNRIAPYSFRFSTGGGVNAPVAPRLVSVGADRYHPLPGQPVTATAAAEGVAPFVFRFQFEGEWTAWNSAASAQHAYPSEGRQRVLVQARDANGLVATEPLDLLVVTPPVGPAPTRSGTVVVGEDAPGVRRAWVVNPDNDTVAVVDPVSGVRIAEYAVGRHPRSIARDALGRYWVTAQDSDELHVLDAGGRRVHRLALPYGSAPFGIAASPDGQHLYVTLGGSARLRRYSASEPTATPLERETFPTPRAIAVSGDGSRVLVTRFLSAELEAEVGEFRGNDLVPVRTFQLAAANTTDSGDRAAGVPNQLAGIAISPDGTRAVVVSQQANVLRGLFFGVADLTHETTVRSVLSVLDLEANREIRNARRDFDNSDSPSAVAFTPLGDTILATLQGNNRIVGIDARSLEPVTGITAIGTTLTSPAVKTVEAATGLAPQGLAIDPEDGRIVVQNFLGRTATVFDGTLLLRENRSSLPTVAAVPTTHREALAATALAGKRIFYNAADPRLSAEGYISCASCHLDGGSDGRVWDFTGRGEGLRRTTDLRGRAGTGHGNVHWTANFDEIQDFEHDIRGAFGGSGFLPLTPAQFAAQHPSPVTTKAGASPELDALAAYVASLGRASVPRSPHRAVDGTLSAAAAAGRDRFLALDCQRCHVGRSLTDSATRPVGDPLLQSVGTTFAGSGRRLGQSLPGIDTPTLLGLHATGRYLHHGLAGSLEEVFDFAGGALHLAARAERIGGAAIGAETDDPVQGGGGFLRAVWGGTVVNVSGSPGNGVRFPHVDGGPGGMGRIRIRHIHRGLGNAVLRVNGDSREIPFLRQLPDNAWMVSGWRWAQAEVELLPGTNNVVEVLRSGDLFGDFQIDSITVSHAGDLAAAEPHRVVRSLPEGQRVELFAFLRSLDGGPVPGLVPNSAPTAVVDTVDRTPGRSLKIPVSTLLANDVDPDGPDPLVLVAFPDFTEQGVPLALQDGFLLYDPPTTVGEDGFLYRAGDGELSSPARVTIRVVSGPPGTTLNIRSTAWVGDILNLDAIGIPGRTYRMERSPGLTGPWEPVAGAAAQAIAPPTGSLGLRDASPSTSPTGFYRVVEVTNP